ncbi:molybdate ABC transporter substrate-binding protein [Halobacillus aidingensis]|uniref:Molybdate transport system substrate-binding protein n=1 Tax=Halobacillus aidingensis TaxID=240303 RepID=A0A1H0EX04_HALAD|nr:molybdate ABC transporter substrate-binding protein [Halobacillus aidingensis]SDN86902.1 molybdate transport system substrate-binding protein [Halobacillus aidingensis]
MRKLIWIWSSMILLFLCSCASPSDSSEMSIRIAAAASLKDVMEELTPLFEEQYNIEIETIYGGSGKLARQIEQGAPVDVFLSADLRWIELLKEQNLVEEDTYIEYATNRIVLIGDDSTSRLDTIQELNLKENEQLAVGNPESVPAGTYTKQALERIQLWSRLEDQMVFGSDVRQVLAYVESGQVDYGFVYASDAMISDRVITLTKVDHNLHDSIVYPGIVISKSRAKEQGQKFLTFLTSDRATEIYNAYGFNPLRGGKIEQ